MLAVACAATLAISCLAVAAADSVVAAGRPAHENSQTSNGFAPPEQQVLAPIVRLAPPGPHRAARSLKLFDGVLALQRTLLFHPVIERQLQQLIDKLPPRLATLIRAAALYSRDDLGWSERPPDVHYIALIGRPNNDDYLYSWAPVSEQPKQPGNLSGAFELRPAEPADGSVARSVLGELEGQMAFEAFSTGAMVDFTAEMLREFYGDAKPPWDLAPGVFNWHDRAAMARFARDLPALAERLLHYLAIQNILDEMADKAGPFVLVNLDARVREEALVPFPHLRSFYRAVAPRINASVTLDDGQGRQWLRLIFDRGRIRIVFLVRAGMLTPMDSRLTPAGKPVPLDHLENGHYRSIGSVSVHRMGMDFGLDKVSFETDYHRGPNDLRFTSHMDKTPDVIAPPIVHKLLLMIAGRFLRTLATGNGGSGLSATFSSKHQPDRTLMAFDAQGEFRYSPALELLARVGDAIANAHNEAVRADERRLGEELFDAFMKDYNNTRAALLALDRDEAD